MNAGRPDADAALAALAPDGVLAEKHLSRLDVRCTCGELLVRVIATPAGLLAVARHHNPPMPRQLAAKGDGWKGGGRQEARVIIEGNSRRVADPLGFHIGWYDDPSWLDDEHELFGAGHVNARCRCGLFFLGDAGEIATLLRAAIGNDLRNIAAPAHLLLDDDAHRAATERRHEAIAQEHQTRRELGDD